MALCRNSAIPRQVVTIDSCVGTGTLLYPFLCRSISITASLCAPFIALPSVRMDVILPVRVAITIARCPRWRPPIYIHRLWVVHMCCCRQSMHCPPIDNCNCTIHCSIRWNSNPRKVSNPLHSFACLTPGWLHSTSLYFHLPPLPFAVPNFLELAPSVLGKSGHAPSSAKAQSYQNVNLLHGPALSAFKKTPGGSKTYVDSYGKTHVSAHNNHLSLSTCDDHDKHYFNDPIQRQKRFSCSFTVNLMTWSANSTWIPQHKSCISIPKLKRRRFLCIICIKY